MNASVVTFLAGVGAEGLQEVQPILVWEDRFLGEEGQAEELVQVLTRLHKTFEVQAQAEAETYPHHLQIAYQTSLLEIAMALAIGLAGISHVPLSETD